MRKRTTLFIGGGLLAAALTFGTAGALLAQTPPQATPGPGGWGPGGMMGMMGGRFGSLMGPGGSGGPGGQSGLGMMGGFGPQGMMGGYWHGTPGAPATATPLGSLADAQTAFQAYVDRIGNADLVLGEVLEFPNDFYAIVKEKSTGTGAFELLANKQTGFVFPEFGPNMMWNTKYGHLGQNSWMAQMMGYQPPSGPLTVTAAQARQIAEQWLAQNQPGAQAETPDAFYGYYTVHAQQDGKPAGMLSVNGYTGQVWYHIER